LSHHPLEEDVHAEVVVVGGGLSGCLAAIELTRRHRPVVLLEAAAIGGQEPRTGHVPTGPAHSYHRAQGVDRSAWEWTRDGHRRLRDWLSTLGGELGYRQAGAFLLAEDRAAGLLLAIDEDALREDGFASEFLDHYMLEARFDVRGAAGALWVADDGELDAARLVASLAAQAVGRGARLHERSPVLRLETSAGGVTAVTPGGRVFATAAVVAAGESTGELLPVLDGLWRGRALSGAIHDETGHTLPTPVRALDQGLAWSARDGRLVVTAEAIDGPPGALPEAIEAFVTRHVGALGRPRGQWSATLASTLDGHPVIGRLDTGPVSVAAGYGDLALAWAPLAAGWAVESLLGSRDPVPAALRASRTAEL
jgi:gamma-glutamylputrescine oxidase